MHFLPSVKTFCGAGALYENILAPTKHNVLCQGRSALDVILSHPDFVYREAVQYTFSQQNNDSLHGL